MSQTVTFTQWDATNLYILDTGPKISGYTIGFLASGRISFNQPVKLDQTWGDTGGLYFFLAQSPGSLYIFHNQLYGLKSSSANQNLRFIWIDNPGAPMASWRTSQIDILQTEQGAATAGISSFGFRNYSFFLSGSSPVNLGKRGDGFVFDNPKGLNACLTTNWGADKNDRIGEQICLDFNETAGGCFRFEIRFDPEQDKTDGKSKSDLELMQVGLRYFIPRSKPFAGRLEPLNYPLFSRTATINFEACLDPLNHLNIDRTFLSFYRKETDTLPPIRSYFTTNKGRRIALTPCSGSRLVMAPQPLLPGGCLQSDPYYMVPHGTFIPEVIYDEANTESRSNNFEMICGFAGSEYLQLNRAGHRMKFMSGRPAYARDFREVHPADGAKNAGTSRERLYPDATTAWVTFYSEKESVKYCAQPPESILYHQTEKGPTGGGPVFLSYYEANAGSFPVASGDIPTANYCPMVPFAGISKDGIDDYKRLETEIISQERRQAIYSMSLKPEIRSGQPDRSPTFAAGAGEEMTAYTPQGLLAVFDRQTDAWKSLTLARRSYSDADNEEKTKTDILKWQGIDDPLKSALLSNRQFLVISSMESFERYFPEDTGTIQMDGWNFVLNPISRKDPRNAVRYWNRHGTMVIVKNYDKSLKDLARDTKYWVLASEFNTDAELTRKRLVDFIEEAEKKRDDSAYEHFVVTVVNDPRWNGILFLNAFVPLTNLPRELSGLTAGIDPLKFYAHHFGINQTPIVLNGREEKNSSLFGLIHYRGDRLSPYSTDYAFGVKSLKVLFANSAIENFSADVTLKINRLFAVPVKRKEPQTNILHLNGIYQTHNGSGSYVFKSDEESEFVVQTGDPVLEKINIIETQFATVVKADNDNGDEDDGTIETRFSFRGELEFKQIEEADQPDLISFKRLAYSNLGLKMSFSPRNPLIQNFEFDPGETNFDPSESQVRKNSLFNHFPLKIRSLLAGHNVAKSPTALGYMPVSTNLDNTDIGYPWYGLNFQLDLGNLGDLVSKAGIIAELAIVWTPGQYRDQYFVGLKLPGSTGAKNEISLMGLIKITMYNVELAYTLTHDGENQVSRNREGSFLLKLNGIVLSFLSKTLPPGGALDFYIFGDPAGSPDNRVLGWYGAYKKDKPEPDPKKIGPPLPRFSSRDFDKMVSRALPADRRDGK